VIAGPFEQSGGREESPDSIVANSQEAATKGNAPGNARGLVQEERKQFLDAATESATENKPPVRFIPRRQVFGKTGGPPHVVGAFGKGEKVG
jgi:hypothetical protein